MGHGDDLGYIFPMSPPGFPKSVVTPAQHRTRGHLLDIVESFAKTGRPLVTSGEKEEWRAVKGREAAHLEVAATLGMARDPATSSKLEFWRGLRERSREAGPPLADLPPTAYHDKIACKRLTRR